MFVCVREKNKEKYQCIGVYPTFFKIGIGFIGNKKEGLRTFRTSSIFLYMRIIHVNKCVAR